MYGLLTCLFLLLFAGFIIWYFPWVKWILNPEKCKIAFDSILNFEKNIFVTKNQKIICLSFYGLAFAFALPLDLAAFWLGWYLLAIFNSLTSPYIISLSLIFAFGNLFYLLIYWLLWKKMSVNSVKKTEVIENFIIFKQSQLWNKNSQFSDYKVNTPIFSKTFAIENKHLQYQWKSFQKRIQNLQNKNLAENEYNWKLSRIFITYLTRFSYFISILERKNSEDKMSLNNQSLSDLNEFKQNLINNFFILENRKKMNLKDW